MNTTTFKYFLNDWEADYNAKAALIPIFTDDYAANWSNTQKQSFAAYFYHIRGHFVDFLWFLGNQAPERRYKEIVLKNIADELSLDSRSHEALFFQFSDELGINLRSEYIEGKYNLPVIKAYNKEHLLWLNTHSWSACFAAFSAYERLDNLDYTNLLKLIKGFNLSKKAEIFFVMHRQIEHFGVTLQIVNELWDTNREEVIAGFNFIAEHQINIWEILTDLTTNPVGTEILTPMFNKSTEVLAV